MKELGLTNEAITTAVCCSDIRIWHLPYLQLPVLLLLLLLSAAIKEITANM